jgi:hypothetical protein
MRDNKCFQNCDRKTCYKMATLKMGRKEKERGSEDCRWMNVA